MQQPDDAPLEIDALDAVEFDLGAVVPGKDLLRDVLGLGLGDLAVRLPADRQERLFQLARMVLGDHHVAFLMSLDVGSERIPDQRDIGFGPAATAASGAG